MLENFAICFIPIFVAINALGILPLYLSLTEGMNQAARAKLTRDATVTALAVSSAFVFVGKPLFLSLGITADDFRIGGGIVILLVAIMDLLFSDNVEKRRVPVRDVGIVPLGVPLIIGPAAMTTLLMQVDRYGYWPTLLSLVANLLVTWLVFSQGQIIVKIVGKAGTRVFTKVFSLILAAIAVMMIRVGIAGTLMLFKRPPI